MKTLAAATCLLALAVTPAGAEETLEQRFATLLALLSHDEWATREQATQDLIALGPAAIPLVQEALKGAADAEVRMRLEEVVKQAGKLRWAPGVKGAVEEALRSKRPILLVCADGPRDAAQSRAGEMLRNALVDEDLVAELNRKFVLVWWNADVPNVPDDRKGPAAGTPSAEGDADPAGRIAIYVCSPSGKVRHHLPGAWTAKTLKEDLARVDALVAASDASEALKARGEQLRRLEAETEKVAADHPEDMANPGSEIRLDVERRRRVAAAWRAGEETVGEPIETHLGFRMKDWKARWGAVQPPTEER